MEKLNNENLIAAGMFALVYRISLDRVRKVARNNEPDNIQAMANEAAIYTLLGHDSRIARWIAVGSSNDYVDIEWASHGTLPDYMETLSATAVDRLRFARHIIKAVQFIHSRGVIHSDLCLRQFLVYEDRIPRLSDFGASGFPGQDAMGIENVRYYLPRSPDSPNSVKSDLFALGSTLYELMTEREPYFDKEDDEIEDLYRQSVFPDTDTVLCGSIISGCWKQESDSASDVYEAMVATELSACYSLSIVFNKCVR